MEMTMVVLLAVLKVVSLVVWKEKQKVVTKVEMMEFQ
jgi:hypothetical protein